MININTAYEGIIYGEVADTVVETIEDRFLNGEVDVYELFEARGFIA